MAQVDALQKQSGQEGTAAAGKCSGDICSLDSATCDPCSHGANCSSEEGEGETVILASTEQDRRGRSGVSLLYERLYAMDAFLFCPCSLL